MHFLTLAAVEIPPQEENLVENKWVEEQKKELLEKLEKNEKKDVFLQVMLQRLNHLSTPFSRTVDAAVAEQLEPFSVNTDDPNCLEFVDQTEELEQEYEGSIDCIRLPKGRLSHYAAAPIVTGLPSGMGKWWNAMWGLLTSSAAPGGPNGCRPFPAISFGRCTRISTNSPRNGSLPNGMRNSRPMGFTATPTANGTGIPLEAGGLASYW